MSTGPIDTSADTPKDVNTRGIWPQWAKTIEWQDALHKKATHKYLDIPLDDDMNITNTKTGITTPGALGIAGILGTTALGLGYMNKPDTTVIQSPPVAPLVAPVDPADSEYEVRFFDKDGNPIVVPHISTRPKE